MPPPRTRPPHVADERTQLLGWYDLQRAVVHFKAEGLSDADAHRSVIPSSPLMTIAGVVSHLRWVEHMWFEILFLGKPAEGPAFLEEAKNAEMRVEGVALAQLLEEYDKQCLRSDEIIAAHSFDNIGQHPDYPAGVGSLRWIVIHMVEETARHAGHLDLIRELIDGQVGYYHFGQV